MNICGNLPAVSLCPAAHTSQRGDHRLSKLRQGILNRNGLRWGHVSRDQSRGFEIAKSPCQHPLRDASNSPAQFSVPVRPLFQREQNLGCPSSDKDGGQRIGLLYRHRAAFSDCQSRGAKRNQEHLCTGAKRDRICFALLV
jgi:hypothetical protein